MQLHPLLMITGTLLCLFAGWQGFIRFQARRAGTTPPADTWKRHINAGRLMLILVGLGAFFGMRVVLETNMRGPHTTLGTIAVWGALMMMISGMMLASGKGKTWYLRTIHALMGLGTLTCLVAAGALMSGRL